MADVFMDVGSRMQAEVSLDSSSPGGMQASNGKQLLVVSGDSSLAASRSARRQEPWLLGAGDPQPINSTTDFTDNTDKKPTIQVWNLSDFIRDISEIRG
jgi:hypothetical protein